MFISWYNRPEHYKFNISNLFKWFHLFGLLKKKTFLMQIKEGRDFEDLSPDFS